MPPRLCFNCPAVVAEVTRFAQSVVGAEIAAQLATFPLDQFAGVIVGWETHMGHDYPSQLPNGWHAFNNSGGSTTGLTSNLLGQHIEMVVSNYINLWASSMAAAGIPTNKIYSHVGFLTNQTYSSIILLRDFITQFTVL